MEAYNKVQFPNFFQKDIKFFNIFLWLILTILILSKCIITFINNQSILRFTSFFIDIFYRYILGLINNHLPTFYYIEYRIRLLNSYMFDRSSQLLHENRQLEKPTTEVLSARRAGSTRAEFTGRNNRGFVP